jgi:hypothetical protein
MRTLSSSKQLRLLLLPLLLVMILAAPSTSWAVGVYNNAAIADKALSYVGQWGGNACNDAQKPGDSGGQCRAFVNCIVWMVSGHTQNLGGNDYFQPFLNAGGVEIKDINALTKGDIVQVGQGIHTFIIVGRVSGSTFNVVDSNHDNHETVMNYNRTVSLDSNTRAFRMGTAESSSGSSGVISLLNGDSAVYAKDSISGSGGWQQQTAGGTAVQIAAAGSPQATTQMLTNGCSAVYAKSGIAGSGGWTQETDCGTAKAIAVGYYGAQMLLTWDNAVYAKNSIGYGDWTREAYAGTVQAIAAGDNTQMIINTCGAVYAKNAIGTGGWTQETDCNTARAIDVSSTGVQLLINSCNAVYAKNAIGTGGWVQETDCGTAVQIAVGGNTQMLINSCAAVYAKGAIGIGGWTQETDCGTAKAIAVGSYSRQVLLNQDNAVYAKGSLNYGGWIQQTDAGAATAITAG